MELCPYRRICSEYGERDSCKEDPKYCEIYNIRERTQNRDALRPETADSGLEIISEESIFIN